MADTLQRYRDKRDFSVTPEPAPAKRFRRSGGLSFVVQKHDARRLHYDFRLEVDGVLKSWAVTRGPSLDPGDKRLAVETEDHPLDYGGFEGTIPAGEYGGGTVMLWDRGTWAMADDKDVHEGLKAGALTFDLHGERLKGRWHLQRMKAEKGRPPQWLLIKTRDAAASESVDVTAAAKSVATGRTMAQIAGSDSVWHSDRPADDQPDAALKPLAAPAKPTAKAKRRSAAGRAAAKGESGEGVPAFVAPALCASRSTPPAGDWIAEVKYDGYRGILRAANGAVTILTRGEKDWTHRFPDIAAAARPLAERDLVLDGELVVFDEDGRTSFGRLQRAFRAAGAVEAAYVAFDLLFLDGEDWRDRPIEARKAELQSLLTRRHRPIVYGDHVATGKQAALYRQAEANGLEGIIAKRAGSRYRSGRHESWVKVRAVRAAPLVVGGYTEGGAHGLGALLLGAYQGDKLVPVGRVGTGFNRSEATRLLAELRERGRKSSPFSRKLEGKGHHFVRPDLVAQVAYLAMTDDGLLRHPSYKGLTEMDPHDVALPSDHPDTETDRATDPPAAPTKTPARAERASGPTPLGLRPQDVETYGVTLSHPDKMLFPEQGVTKLALAQHYAAHMERMLPHVAGRPLTLVRCPQGRAKKCFYQRHPEGMPERMRRDIGEADGAAIVVEQPADIMELVQLGVLEIHLRGARADRPDKPDRLVFDLDPGDGVPFEAIKDAAHTVRDRLARLDLVSFVKTTGGKGLHVVVPIERRTPWDEAKAWTRALAEELATAEPDRFLTKMTKSKRTGRIFLDYLRNDTKSSAVAPYSVRSREGAPFSLPVGWDALDKLQVPQPVHVGDIAGDDPWAGIEDVRQSLTAARKKAVGL
ncbi:DNA ligase D [Acuticoccus sp. I52.16.1]|uniref:DNA ligase D n=1 Tax=Acuticoccus sp. I52.16.1 TaxID=2928472 RepID=UPI001FD04809|nr:DNA ligase D [Acuticoccus sp. I52.16.1]UOM34472.1 DNA ligase D [Acuticoccus sp. I52.16.1]